MGLRLRFRCPEHALLLSSQPNTPEAVRAVDGHSALHRLDQVYVPANLAIIPRISEGPVGTQKEARTFMFRLSENGVSLITARRHITFYGFLNLDGLVNYGAPGLVKVRQMPPMIQPYLSEEEARRLMDAAQTPREKALAEFFYGTGSRLSEVLHLRITDLDLTLASQGSGRLRTTDQSS